MKCICLSSASVSSRRWRSTSSNWSRTMTGRASAIAIGEAATGEESTGTRAPVCRRARAPRRRCSSCRALFLRAGPFNDALLEADAHGIHAQADAHGHVLLAAQAWEDTGIEQRRLARATLAVERDEDVAADVRDNWRDSSSRPQNSFSLTSLTLSFFMGSS